MREKLATLILQLCLNYLRAGSQDIRLCYDEPVGTLTFQGVVKYARKFPIPKRKHV